MATGETVAVKEIQLSNIPKGELPEIQVCLRILHSLSMVDPYASCVVRD